MTPRLIQYEGATFVGIDAVTSNAAEADPSRQKIAPMWMRFYREGLSNAIPGKMGPPIPTGVYSDYESDHNGPYRLLVGVRVQEGTTPPAGMAQALVPAGKYLVFSGEGQMPRVVVETWNAIWKYFAQKGEHTRAFTADFEQYRGPSAIDIYISVR